MRPTAVSRRSTRCTDRASLFRLPSSQMHLERLLDDASRVHSRAAAALHDRPVHPLHRWLRCRPSLAQRLTTSPAVNTAVAAAAAAPCGSCTPAERRRQPGGRGRGAGHHQGAAGLAIQSVHQPAFCRVCTRVEHEHIPVCRLAHLPLVQLCGGDWLEVRMQPGTPCWHCTHEQQSMHAAAPQHEQLPGWQACCVLAWEPQGTQSAAPLPLPCPGSRARLHRQLVHNMPDCKTSASYGWSSAWCKAAVTAPTRTTPAVSTESAQCAGRMSGLLAHSSRQHQVGLACPTWATLHRQPRRLVEHQQLLVDVQHPLPQQLPARCQRRRVSRPACTGLPLTP